MLTCGYWMRVCWTAKAAAGVTRASQSVGPTGRMGTATVSRYGRTITTITAATAAALRRSTVPMASAMTAAAASTAAVPTITRTSVSAVTGQT